MTNTPSPELEAKALVRRLRTKANMINMGEKIAWGSDTLLMDEAADWIEDTLPARPGVGERTWPQVIAFIRSLPGDCPGIESSLYVDRETADAAAEDCEFLAGIGAAVPKVFSHGDDALVLHWELPDQHARYLTIHKEDRPAFLTVGRGAGTP